MASSVIAVEWLNQNAARNYPFREDCGMRPNDSAGNLIEDGWRVPNYLITDFVVGVVGASYDPTIYLKQLSVISRNATLTFADADGNDAFIVAASDDDSIKSLSGLGTYIDAKGAICFGDLTRFFDETPEGLYTFAQEESLIEVTCVRPSAVGVHSIATEDAAGYTTSGLRGDVKLVAGDNINIRYDILTNSLIVSADPNSGYTDGCDCDEEDLSVVRSINGIRTEDVTIVGDDCINITTADGIITISDSCSKPCCGCAETAFINQSINDLQSSVNTLTNNAAILSDRITNFVDNYLLAKKTLD